MATGGSLESMSFAGREFSVAADSDANMAIGGINNEVLPNGNRTFRTQKTVVAWSYGPISLVIDPNNGDLEFLQERANEDGPHICTFTEVGGEVTYEASGQAVGAIERSSMTTTAPITFSGGGTLTKQ